MTGVVACGICRTLARRPGEEPWSFGDGIGIWPTEIIRIAAVLLAIACSVAAYWGHRRHGRRLGRDYFQRKDFDQWCQSLWCLRQRFRPFRSWVRKVGGWGTVAPDKRGRVVAQTLFEAYVRGGFVHRRHLRAIVSAVGYAVLAFAIVTSVGGMPERLCVRVLWSARIDLWLLGLTIFCFLVVLFYALDAARLSDTMLESLARRAAVWPEALTEKWARQKGLRAGDFDGWLKVRFAADKTRETGRLMFTPFVIFFLLLLSRNSYFEAWTWTRSSIAIFAANFVIAATCWAVVRHSARHLRAAASAQLAEVKQQVEVRGEKTITVPLPETPAVSAATGLTVACPKRTYLKRLEELADDIKKERRGAFAHWIQDPTYIALFIPTGVTGILTVLVHYWLSKP